MSCVFLYLILAQSSDSRQGKKAGRITSSGRFCLQMHFSLLPALLELSGIPGP